MPRLLVTSGARGVEESCVSLARRRAWATQIMTMRGQDAAIPEVMIPLSDIHYPTTIRRFQLGAIPGEEEAADNQILPPNADTYDRMQVIKICHIIKVSHVVVTFGHVKIEGDDTWVDKKTSWVSRLTRINQENSSKGPIPHYHYNMPDSTWYLFTLNGSWKALEDAPILADYGVIGCISSFPVSGGVTAAIEDLILKASTAMRA